MKLLAPSSLHHHLPRMLQGHVLGAAMVLALGTALLTGGCTSMLAQVSGGTAWSTRSPGSGGAPATNKNVPKQRDPVAFEISIGEGKLWGFGLSTVLRRAPAATEWGAGGEVYYVHAPWVVSPIVHAGVRAVSLGSVDGSFSFGAMSPYVNGGLVYFFGRDFDSVLGYYVALQGTMELAVRFTGQPAEAYGGVMLGIGFGYVTWERHIRGISDEVF